MRSIFKSSVIVLTVVLCSCGNQNNTESINTPTPPDSSDQRASRNDSGTLGNSSVNGGTEKSNSYSDSSRNEGAGSGKDSSH